METKQSAQAVTYKCDACGKQLKLSTDKAVPICCNKPMRRTQ
jgi:endogenous inhibitor of DNA gyrase (YacG/DUF329 family)